MDASQHAGVTERGWKALSGWLDGTAAYMRVLWGLAGTVGGWKGLRDIVDIGDIMVGWRLCRLGGTVGDWGTLCEADVTVEV